MYQASFSVPKALTTCMLPVLLALFGCSGGPTGNSGPFELAFVQQPQGAISGLAFVRQPVIEIRDGSGQLVTPSSPVTLALTGNAPGATLSGSTVVTAVGGAARFSDLAIDLVGSGYQLTATAPNAEPATSLAFSVTGPISAAMSQVTAPASLLLVSDTMTVTLQARDAAGTALTRGGSAVSFGLDNAGTTTGTFGNIVDRADGTYTALFTSTGSGTPVSIRAMVEGVPVGTPAPSLTVVTFVAVSAGLRHTCGVTNTDQVLCWGSNAAGQLGVGPASSRTPLLLPGPLAWTGVSAGHRNTCALAEAGTAYCWGNNEYSQVGDGTWSVRQDEPAAVSGGLSFAWLDASLGVTTGSVLLDQGFVNCGVTTSGQGYCWGDGRFGQIGNGDVAEQAVPTLVSGGLTFGSVAAGSMHACGIATNGHPYCWGVDANGQLGLGNSFPLFEQCDGLLCSTTPRQVNTTRVFALESIVVGTDHSCALSGGLAYCWGANRFGALGDGTGTTRISPVPVSGNRSYSALSAGDAMTCGLASSGATYCWGKVSGAGTTSSLVPVALSGGISFVQLDAGGSHACGTTDDGAVYCWGSNTYGQLGNGTLISSNSPVRIKLR